MSAIRKITAGFRVRLRWVDLTHSLRPAPEECDVDGIALRARAAIVRPHPSTDFMLMNRIRLSASISFAKWSGLSLVSFVLVSASDLLDA